MPRKQQQKRQTKKQRVRKQNKNTRKGGSLNFRMKTPENLYNNYNNYNNNNNYNYNNNNNNNNNVPSNEEEKGFWGDYGSIGSWGQTKPTQNIINNARRFNKIQKIRGDVTTILAGSQRYDVRSNGPMKIIRQHFGKHTDLIYIGDTEPFSGIKYIEAEFSRKYSGLNSYLISKMPPYYRDTYIENPNMEQSDIYTFWIHPKVYRNIINESENTHFSLWDISEFIPENIYQQMIDILFEEFYNKLLTTTPTVPPREFVDNLYTNIRSEIDIFINEQSSITKPYNLFPKLPLDEYGMEPCYPRYERDRTPTGMFPCLKLKNREFNEVLPYNDIKATVSRRLKL